MPPTSRLYDALSQFLSQCQPRWQDARHLQTLCWMMVGLIESQKVHLNGFGVYVNSRATFAQSHQRRFRRWLSNRRIDVMSAHHDLIRQALSQWSKERLYLSLDTTMVWNCLLHRLGGCGLPRTNRAGGMAGGGTVEQYGATVDDSTGTTPSRRGDATGC